MLLSWQFIDGVLHRPQFGSHCLSVFIDEAHCISHWGDLFCKKYASLGIIRPFLPKSTPIIAVTATLTPRIHNDLITKLQFDHDNYLFINIGNNRPNVSQVVHAMEHLMNTYCDLDFLVPEDMSHPEDIKKGFLYCDDINLGGNIVDNLNARVMLEFHGQGLICPYNAAMSRKYRADVMQLFKAGVVRILVCTDAAGMVSSIAI
jgi:superfamily II DNA helicase RecQ